jgi:hypothetical protein
MKRGITLKRGIFFAAVLVFICYFFLQIPTVVSWGPGQNYKNYSVRTTVNVTEAFPEILNISCNYGQPVILTAGSTAKVVCVVMVRDYNGGDTIVGANGSGVFNASFFYFQNKSSDPNDNNVHYSNQTCSLNGTSIGYYVNWTCAFDVWYYANNGTWRINASVLDTHNNQNLSITSEFNGSIGVIYALNVTDVIDYGKLFVGETSSAPIQANVTNFGNSAINVTVYGFGGDNISRGSGLAMICEQRNLSLTNERFSLSSSEPWATMNVLSGAPQMLQNLTLPKQVQDGVFVVNATYWSLHINVTDNPYGVCNGTVVFSAIQS